MSNVSGINERGTDERSTAWPPRSTQNVSLTSNSSEIAIYQRLWVRDAIFAWILTAAVVYLVISIGSYEYRKATILRAASEGKSKRSRRQKFEAFLTKGRLCLVAAVFTMLRCLGEQIELGFGTTSDAACLLYQHLYVYNYQVPLLSLYLLLWARQRKLYQHRTLRHLTSPQLRFLSAVVIVGIFASSFVTVFVYFYNFKLVSSRAGCVYQQATQSSGTPGLMMFASAFVFQVLLMGLLVYPLVRHYHIALCCSKIGSAQPGNGTHSVKKTVTRIALCTVVCVTSDFIIATSMALFHHNNSPIMFWANVYSLNLLVNLVTVTCSFVDCKRRLFPCYSLKYDEVAFVNHTFVSTTV